MGKSMVLLSLLAVLACAAAGAQSAGTSESKQSLFSLTLTPLFSLPLGNDSAVFAFGAGADLSAEFRIPSLPLLFVGGSVGYSFLPLQGVESIGVSLLDGEISAGLRFDLLPSLSMRLFGAGGYHFAMLNDGSGRGAGDGIVTAGANITLAVTPAFGLGLGASYRNYWKIYNDIAVTLGLSYNLPSAEGRAAAPVQQTPAPAKPEPLATTPQEQPEIKGKGLVIKSLSLDAVYPVLHAFYDTSPLGTMVLRNSEDFPITDVTVTLIVRQFMDAPKDCVAIAEVKPGEEKSVDLLALFKNTIFETKQSTKVPAEIAVSYTLGGKQQTTSKVETLRIYDRNALSWDDTNKAAAFVMPKEPAVLMLSNQINSFVKAKMNRAIDKNLQTAMAFHDALRLLGIAYVSPPLTSYAVRSQNKTAVDSVKFPLETIQYRSGDCSDLAVLYCSLLESVQIETAFITIPGHIFMAFALGASEEDARKTFTETDEFIFRLGKVWVPVEVTDREGSFLQAWQAGAREWRENLLKKQAEFYPLRAAWETYEPVNYPGIGSQPPLPEAVQVVKDFQADVVALVTREISAKETSLLAAASKANNSAKTVNALGVLYARYDLSDKAEEQFQASLKSGEYAPALVNLGNLRLRDKRVEDALAFYQRAYAKAPHDALVLLGLARCNHELQNYGLAKTQYEELRTRSPELAGQFAYLRLQGEEATRAAQASQAGDLMVWGEEQ